MVGFDDILGFDELVGFAELVGFDETAAGAGDVGVLSAVVFVVDEASPGAPLVDGGAAGEPATTTALGGGATFGAVTGGALPLESVLTTGRAAPTGSFSAPSTTSLSDVELKRTTANKPKPSSAAKPTPPHVRRSCDLSSTTKSAASRRTSPPGGGLLILDECGSPASTRCT